MKRFLISLTLAGLCAAMLNPQVCAQEPHASLGFHPPGMWTWDNWFAYDGKQWHAFYLQLPQAVGPDRRWKNNDFYKHVGHATSTNLRDWQDQGPAVCALSGTWNDRHIATGSVVRYEGKWWMAFTGRGTHGDGVGLAVSDDLTIWRPAQDTPLLPLASTWGKEADGAFASDWEGAAQRWVGISDPYILPEPVDGWYLMVLCSRILGVPLSQSGCLTVLRSHDLRHWEKPEIIAWPRCFERMETPQLWQRQGHWHLSFGGVLDVPWLKQNAIPLPPAVQDRTSHHNYCYTMDAVTGPAQGQRLQHMDISSGHYIMKVLAVDPAHDVAIFTAADKVNSCISQPYPVKYADDGQVTLEFSR